MKYCLSSRQTPTYLNLCDEIRVSSRDIEQLFDFLDTYPNKTFIYNLENLLTARDTLKKLAKLNQNRITLALYNLDDIPFCQEYNYSYYYIRPCKSLSQAQALKNLGVNQLLIDEPLTHMLHEIKLIGLPIRAIPVYAYLDPIPRDDGVCGNWFRPEDQEAYSVYIDTIEFGYQPEKREQALFRIYAQQKEWAGELGRIVSDLNYIGLNRMLNPEYTLKRMNCGMICAQNKCSICYKLLDFATEDLRESVKGIPETSQEDAQNRETAISNDIESENK